MRHRAVVILFALLFASCTTVNVNPNGTAPDEAPSAPTEQAAAQQDGEDDKEDEADPFAEWDETLEDTEKIDGFIPMHLKAEDRTLYAAIHPDRLGEDFGLIMHISQGTGVFNLHDGLPLSGTRLMRFTRVGNEIHLVHRNVRFTADEGSAMQTSLDGNTGHSTVEAFDIESQNDSTKALLIDMTGFFASDYANIGEQLKWYFNQTPARFQNDKSYVEQVMGFPENVEIDAALTYQGSGPPSFGGEAIPDHRAIPVGVRYSLFALPEAPMSPRFADDRVGHFTTAVKDFSRDQQDSPYRVYVNRWRLTPKDPAARARGELVEPDEPIVFYVDRSVPEPYRPYVKQGIEAWNKAFEAAGYTNAIVAKEAPDDSTWSAEDVRYSTVRWTAAHQMGYAIGPSQTDPRTGEILNADVLISSGFVRGWMRDYEDLTPETMTQALRPDPKLHRMMPDHLAGRLCQAERGKAHQLGLQRALLIGRGVIDGAAPLPEEYLGDAIRDLVMHEVGHTIGLRHNFKASSGIPYDRLHDEQYTRENGLSLSVMDYAPVNIARDADEQGHYWNKEVGTYDEWAVNYAYRPVVNEGEFVTDPAAEQDALDAIARQASDPKHTYGTDEDTWLGPYAVDPLTNAWELGSDPLQFADDRAALVRDVAPKLDERLVQEGDRYVRLRSAMTSLLFERYAALMPVTKMVGGSYVARDHKGDPSGRPPFTPVSADRQREAVQLLVDEVFAPDAFQFEPERLNKLAPNRAAHWGASWSLQIDYPVHDYVETVQRGLLSGLLHPARLKRMMDTELRVPEGEAAYRPSELMTTLSDAIWSELDEGDAINSFRRNLQRMYTTQLVNFMLDAQSWIVISIAGAEQLFVPEHIRSLARLELTELSERIGRTLDQGGLDRDTQAHLHETKVRIDRALDAALTESFSR